MTRLGWYPGRRLAKEPSEAIDGLAGYLDDPGTRFCDMTGMVERASL